MLAGLAPPEPKDGLVDPDEVPEPPDEAVTQPGDLWLLGDHRLLCGDAGNEADMDRLLDGATVDLFLTDPPYNVKVEPRSNNAIAAGMAASYDGSYQAALASSSRKRGTKALDAQGLHHSGFDVARSKSGIRHHQKLDLERHPEKAQATHRKLRAKDRPLGNDFISDADFEALLLAWFGNASRVMRPGGSFYVWGGYANLGNYPLALKAAGLYFSQAIIWDKEHPVLSRASPRRPPTTSSPPMARPSPRSTSPRPPGARPASCSASAMVARSWADTVQRMRRGTSASSIRETRGGRSAAVAGAAPGHAPSTVNPIARAASAWRRSKVSITSGWGRRSAAARCRASSVRTSYRQPSSAARARQAQSIGTT